MDNPWAEDMAFQPFLRFNILDESLGEVAELNKFQPFLRFNVASIIEKLIRNTLTFQPFLRFNGSCVRFLWVFKFFFGFL